MGFGLPSAMGVQFAYPEAVVACVTGEGSFMMNMQELSTCLQYGLPVKIINLNNQALGMVKQWQDMQYSGRHSSSTYSDSLPDFKTLVEAFGHHGIKVEQFDQLEAALEEAFSKEMQVKLVFVDVWVDPEEHVSNVGAVAPWQIWFSQEMKRSQNDRAYYFGSLENGAGALE